MIRRRWKSPKPFSKRLFLYAGEWCAIPLGFPISVTTDALPEES